MHGRIALVAAMPLAGALPATASADEAVGELGRTTPIAAYAGWEAWSAYDEASRLYTPTLRDPQGTVRPHRSRRRPRSGTSSSGPTRAVPSWPCTQGVPTWAGRGTVGSVQP